MKKLKAKMTMKARKRKVKKAEMTPTLILTLSNYIMLMLGIGQNCRIGKF